MQLRRMRVVVVAVEGEDGWPCFELHGYGQIGNRLFDDARNFEGCMTSYNSVAVMANKGYSEAWLFPVEALNEHPKLVALATCCGRVVAGFQNGAIVAHTLPSSRRSSDRSSCYSSDLDGRHQPTLFYEDDDDDSAEEARLRILERLRGLMAALPGCTLDR
jgi:hypothetical protein